MTRYQKYLSIYNRAKKMNIIHTDKISALMDIESADIKFHLKLND